LTRAGLGKVDISTSVTGAELMGYSNRDGGAVSVHDPLFARALVVERGGQRVALCSLDLCAVNEDVVAAARARIAHESGIPPEQVFISATHTHSAPHDDDSACWPDGLEARIAAAIEQACGRLTPARIGAGWGLLHGHALNRRRLEDPVDPAVFVMRIDAAGGAPLGVYYGFACHPVVLGPDNREVSGDWPGTTGRIVEQYLGPGAVAMFGQGACADANPFTEGVRRRLSEGPTVRVQVEALSYYGIVGRDSGEFHVGDRLGGTFAEAEQLGRAVADEVMRVHRGVVTEEVSGVWTRQIAVAQTGALAFEGARDGGPLDGHAVPRAAMDEPVEVMMVGIDGPDVVLVGQPGEVFSETGVDLRRQLRKAGVRHPFVVGYANGWRTYLAPSYAYAERGYEVEWARAMRLSEALQDDIRSVVVGAIGGTGPGASR
jgi:hypothetical protein